MTIAQGIFVKTLEKDSDTKTPDALHTIKYIEMINSNYAAVSVKTLEMANNEAKQKTNDLLDDLLDAQRFQVKLTGKTKGTTKTQAVGTTKTKSEGTAKIKGQDPSCGHHQVPG